MDIESIVGAAASLIAVIVFFCLLRSLIQSKRELGQDPEDGSEDYIPPLS